MLIAAYIVQTGLNISAFSFELSVAPQAPIGTQAFQFIIIFMAKGLFVGIISLILHGLLLWAHIFSNLTAAKITGGLFIAFGFLGTFAGGELVFLKTLNGMWFYTAFVVGFYSLSVATDIEDF
jgi:hypothetical protein